MKKVALLVGVDIYEDPNIAQLACAARDARELGVVLRDRLGFEVEVLTDVELSRGKNVMSSLRRLGKDLSDDDIFLFYFSGHGKSVADHDQLFLLPHADAGSVAEGVTGEGIVSYQQLKGATAKWPGVRRGFIFDACRSPLEIKKDGEFARFEGEVVYRDPGFASSSAASAAPLVILNSCHDQERAEELKGYQGGHGLFSAALLETFKQHHERRQPVVIDESLSRTVGERMRQLARQYGSRETEQQPFFVGHGTRDLRLFDREDQREAQRSEQVEELVRAFEDQLNAKHYERPSGDNCKDTLNRLAMAGCSGEVLRGLSSRLDTALVAEKTAGCKDRDEQRIKAARLAGTVEAYAQYLANCEECAHQQEAEEAIERLKKAVAGKGKQEEVEEASRRAAKEKEEHAEAARLRAAEEAKKSEKVPDGVWAGIPWWAKGLGGVVGLYLLVRMTGMVELPPWVAREEAAPVPSTEGLASYSAPEAEEALARTRTGKEKNESLPLKNVRSTLSTYSDPYTGTEFILVKGGCFKMGNTFAVSEGNSDEQPRDQDTCVGDYYLGKYEVTQGEWSKLMKNESKFQKGDRYPVENVSWHQAQEYIDKLKKATGKQYRMPTEAEWEYATRARGKQVKYGTSTGELSRQLANYGTESWSGGDASDGYENTSPVGSYPANSLGLHDMSGNVWEWTCSEYGYSYNGNRETSCADPKSGARPVNRGGSWYLPSLCLRAAYRRGHVLGDRGADLGFRLALPPDRVGK